MPEQAGMEIWIQIHLKIFGLFNLVVITFRPDSYNTEDNKATAMLVNEPGQGPFSVPEDLHL